MASGEQQKGLRTLTWDELEPWQQDNHFIIRGYRAATNSYGRSLQSLAHIHNQTVNIWSHLLGAVAFVAAAFLLHQQLRQALQFDLVLFGVFFAGLLACLTLSSAFHTFGNHSEVIRQCFLLGDLAGIILLTMTSFYPGVYYGFYCEPAIARFYWAMITIFGIGALIVCLLPQCQRKPWRHVRTAILISMGLSGVVPMTHAAQRFGVHQAGLQMGWDWYVGEGIFYVLGAIIYVNKVPEKWKPGYFDIWGSSHQIFHACVLIGAWCHLNGVVKAFKYNHDPQTMRC
ncbi:hemolysin-III related-domain-containing protein [Microdochium trichocladiopsis]|uniref:Hemolysin-III related-domain-containing protein n=1 Tax=Microdochium trichocladiopsis TaxID=1682393 RepID=A0A9P8XVN9_9PEZI|nr:hemolysin-III related-domain-containing protein [Microdochium trichocladiopsis]KAH7021004.1 hemolysin-III related-domain-containing protein [Microdochium trichocladiopsis]